ncbi:MAG: hypothetical protein R3B40_22945 [Polyangiales bacterium]|nr:hypothetical protein [Myxococcales bacterium]
MTHTPHSPYRTPVTAQAPEPMEVAIVGSSLQLGALRVTFHRTLRIPDNGRQYPLPPSLGAFPLLHVDDYADRVPESWREKGGVFLPMYQREAMWISFSGPTHAPRAVQVGVGKVCAITGEPFRDALGDPDKPGRKGSQNYLVTPPQPWLDGICAGHGTIKQFVAMPLGSGTTVEGQVTGEETVGGLQLRVVEAKPGRFPDRPRMTHTGGFPMVPMPCSAAGGSPMPPMASLGAGGFLDAMLAPACAPMGPAPSRNRAASMGLAAGGKMKQKVYPDPHGLDTWDLSRSARCFVHLCNSELYAEITGQPAPPSPISASSYKAHGLPWFDLYDEGASALDTTSKLAGVKSLGELDAEQGLPTDAAHEGLFTKVKRLVRDGVW